MIAETIDLLVWWTLRASLLLGVVGLVVIPLRNRAASLRHALWVSAIAGSLALPVLAFILPSWGILPTGRPPAAAGGVWASEVQQVAVLVPLEEVAGSGSEHVPVDPERPPGEGFAPLVAWDRALLTGWALGTGILLIRLLVGQCSTILLIHFRSRAYLPGVRITGRAIPPMVCGLLAPKIILPTAALAWPDDQLEAVIEHERAHIRRGDLWWGWSARLLCAVQWFNPLVWIAAARMHRESEHACDDAVIRGGMSAKQYAGHLLEVASMIGAARKPLPAVAMASGPEIEGRLRYALEPQRSRRPLRVPAIFGLTLLLTPVTLMIAVTAEVEFPDELVEGDPFVQDSPATGAGPISGQAADGQRKEQTNVLDPAQGDREPALGRGGDALAGGFTKWAESPPGPDSARNQPNSDGLSLSAGSMDYDAERQVVVGKGSVELVVGQMELRGDRVEYSTQTGLLRMSGGSVRFTGGRSEGVSGKATTIEFDEQAGLLKLINHYSLNLGTRLITGSTDTSSATLDLKTGQCTMDGSSMTRLTPSGQAGEPGKHWINLLEQPALEPGLGIPLADGFDFPVGAPDGDGYYVARPALPNGRGHLGEDWNGKGGGNTDEGDPVYSIGNGRVIFARDVRVGHGNVVIIRHVYLDGEGAETAVESVYVHLGEVKVEVGDVVGRGELIGTIGTNRGMYLAHLHFEIRKRLDIGMLRSKFPRDETVYHRPSDFIEANRPRR